MRELDELKAEVERLKETTLPKDKVRELLNAMFDMASCKHPEPNRCSYCSVQKARVKELITALFPDGVEEEG